ncbi:MAG: TetR/AcrR family transcriptional regulator [Lachnospiraceae bacterium]|nr:TetR/AcrR family transcriptional regulator [Candidatus Colinaster equi]
MRKEKILEATLELAYEKGLGRISMSQIAERAGLKKSSLYSHFDSKEEIVEKMYLYFREQAKINNGNTVTDYGQLVEGRTLRDILLFVVNSYKKMNQDPRMNMFYQVMEAERFVNKMAADIMVSETKTMINATKQLFYAMQAKKIAEFPNPDAAAISFAMGVHAIFEYEMDSQMAESSDAEGMMEQFITEFSSHYQKGE